MFLNLPLKLLDVLRGPIAQSLSDVPPRPLAQLALLLLAQRALALHSLADILYTLPNQRARGPRPRLGLDLQPAGEDVPPGRARGHLELEVARPIDELEHRVRRVVAWAVAELVDARVPAWAVGVARRERAEDFGSEGLGGRREEESGGFLPGGVRAFLSERDDLLV